LFCGPYVFVNIAYTTNPGVEPRVGDIIFAQAGGLGVNGGSDGAKPRACSTGSFVINNNNRLSSSLNGHHEFVFRLKGCELLKVGDYRDAAAK
jgi:hypothetical protein